MADEQASREYINQMWAEAMEIYRSGNFRLRFSPAMNDYLKAHQKDFMPEDTKAGQILDYLERYSGSIVCSKQLYKEALGHDYDEPKQWELREINDIMNNAVTGWMAFSNPTTRPTTGSTTEATTGFYFCFNHSSGSPNCSISSVGIS